MDEHQRIRRAHEPPDPGLRDAILASQVLRHVIPVAAGRTTSNGGRVVITSAEIWSHEVVVQWTEICVGEGQPDERPDRFEAVGLTDDDGTIYSCAGVGGGGGPHTQQMRARFLGTPAETASALFFVPPHVEERAGPIRIDLP